MGKIIKLAFMAVFTVMACCGCEWKDPIDEDIEGFWRLERFETHADGQIHECKRIYYGITRMVVEVAERQGPGDYGAFIGRFEYKDGRKHVVMRDFKQRANTSDNGVSATPEDMMPFGMDAATTEFEVVVADGDNLVLRSDYATLQLTRF